MAIDPTKLLLYLITDPHLCSKVGVEKTVDESVKGGVTMVQIRDKHASTEDRVALARRLKPICASRGALLVINDDIKAVQISDVDGVHIGQGDMDVALARQTVGADKIVGLSIETESAATQVSIDLVDYVGVGRVCATRAKQARAPAMGLRGLSKICAASPVSSVAVGGLKLADCHSVMATGVNGMAVVSAICGQDDPYFASCALAKSLARYERQR